MIDIRDIIGQETAKRALEIACVGDHSVMLIGPEGCGKTMLFNAFRSKRGVWFCNFQEHRSEEKISEFVVPSDIEIHMEAVSPSDLLLPPPAETSDVIIARIIAARKSPVMIVRARDRLDVPAREFLVKWIANAKPSARTFFATVAVAGSIAALDNESKAITRRHIAEAASYAPRRD